MNLLKLLLVDDEKIILRGLQETYDWESMGYQVVGAADSGEAALALIEDEEPDVVITDVRMKQIDGLELIERTRQVHPEIKFVVVSAYRDFEYAKKACVQGALSYLVKPIDDRELEDVMKKAYQMTMEHREKTSNYENWKKLLAEKESGFLSQMIERYVKELIDQEELQVLARSLSKEMWANHHFASICMDVDAVYKVTNQVEYDAKRYMLFSRIERELRENYDVWAYTNTDGSRIFVVDLGESASMGKLKLMVERQKRDSDCEIISAISNGYAGLGGMKTSYKQAMKLYQIACEAGAGVLTVSKDAQVPAEPGYFDDIENQVLRSLRKNSQEELKTVFEKMVFRLPANEGTAKMYLHRLTIQVEVMLEDSYEMSENIRAGFSNFYGMIDQYNLVRLIDILYKLLGTVIRERLSLAPVMTEDYFGDYMKAALAYIQDNLQDEDLSIIVVAEKVYLNPVYFGRFFKNVMGVTFKKYVLNARMERAKKLIQENKGGIAEIGAQVGIPNPSYFSQLFKQATGMMPSEFKKENSL